MANLAMHHPIQSAETSRESARAIAAATSQVDLALKEAEWPVDQLGTNITRMSTELEDLRATLRLQERSPGDPTVARDLGKSIELLHAELGSAIQQVQFYDRMFQHLSHVRDYMAAVGARLAAQAEDDETGDRSAQETHPAWEEMRRRLHAKLVSEPQRELLDTMLPPAASTRTNERRERAALGSIELF